MGQGVAEAQRERELSKQALTQRVESLSARVRRDLDWRAKLRHDGLRYAVVGSAALVIAASVILIRSRRPKKETPAVTVTSLEDIASQLNEIRAELARRRKDQGPLWQKLAVRAASAAAAGAGGAAARRAMQRLEGAAEAPAQTAAG